MPAPRPDFDCHCIYLLVEAARGAKLDSAFKDISDRMKKSADAATILVIDLDEGCMGVTNCPSSSESLYFEGKRAVDNGDAALKKKTHEQVATLVWALKQEPGRTCCH